MKLKTCSIFEFGSHAGKVITCGEISDLPLPDNIRNIFQEKAQEIASGKCPGGKAIEDGFSCDPERKYCAAKFLIKCP